MENDAGGLASLGLLVGILAVATAFGVHEWLVGRILQRLRERHPALWEALGRPAAGPAAMILNRPLARLVNRREGLDGSDPWLERRCRLARLAGRAGVLAFVVLAAWVAAVAWLTPR